LEESRGRAAKTFQQPAKAVRGLLQASQVRQQLIRAATALLRAKKAQDRFFSILLIPCLPPLAELGQLAQLVAGKQPVDIEQDHEAFVDLAHAGDEVGPNPGAKGRWRLD